MSARAWRRLWRERGWLALALLVALLLGTALGVNQLIAAHLSMIDDVEAQEATITKLRARQEQLPRLEKALEAERAASGGIVARLVPADEGAPAATGERFSATLRDWYGAQGAKQAAVQNLVRRDEDGLTYLRAEIEAPMGIEQLAALLQNKTAAPLALRLVEASVEANDMNSPTGLRTRMTWEGLAATPRPAPKEATGDKKKADKSSLRSVERGGGPAFKEEKRK